MIPPLSQRFGCIKMLRWVYISPIFSGDRLFCFVLPPHALFFSAKSSKRFECALWDAILKDCSDVPVPYVEARAFHPLFVLKEKLHSSFNKILTQFPALTQHPDHHNDGTTQFSFFLGQPHCFMLANNKNLRSDFCPTELSCGCEGQTANHSDTTGWGLNLHSTPSFSSTHAKVGC